QEHAFEGIERELLAAAPCTRCEFVHLCEARGDRPPRRRGKTQPHQTRGLHGPVEPVHPMKPRLEMRPEQLPPLKLRFDAVIVQGPRTEQYGIAGGREELARAITEASLTGDGINQEPVARA